MQFDRWVAEAIRFATDGSRFYVITFGGRRLDVLGHDDGSRMVVETRRGERRIWSTQEMRDALAAPAIEAARQAVIAEHDATARRAAAVARQEAAARAARLAAAGVRRLS